MAAGPPRITIVTPCLNQRAFLEQTLRSVAEQEGSGRAFEVEHIVIDGGSRDGSVELLEQWSSRLAHWESGPDAGQADAINRGFERGSGSIMSWLNSDDVLLPGSLQAVAHAFRRSEVEAVCGWAWIIDEHGRRLEAMVYPPPTLKTLRVYPRLQQETVFWRRSVWDRVGPLDASLRYCMDRDLWLKMALAGVQPHLIPRFQSGFRRHASQKGAEDRLAINAEADRLLQAMHGEHEKMKSLRKRLPWGWRKRRQALQFAARCGLLRLLSR